MEDTYECTMHFDAPEIYTSQVVGQSKIDGMKIISLELAGKDGVVSHHSFPVSVALAIAHQMMVLGIELQAAEVRK